jgi:hypothetical protein
MIRTDLRLTVQQRKQLEKEATKLTGISMHAGIHEFREPKAPGTPKKDAAGKYTVGKLVRTMSYVGTGAELETIYKMQVREATGQVYPEGAGPDDGPEDPHA